MIVRKRERKRARDRFIYMCVYVKRDNEIERKMEREKERYTHICIKRARKID